MKGADITLISLAPQLSDPDLGGCHFSIYRKIYRTEMGEVVPSESRLFRASGSIQPATAEDMVLFPEEQRLSDMIVLLSPFHFRLGEKDPSGLSFTSSDEIRWRNDKYRVVRVKDWSHQGGYYKAWAIKQKRPETDSAAAGHSIAAS